ARRDQGRLRELERELAGLAGRHRHGRHRRRGALSEGGAAAHGEQQGKEPDRGRREDNRSHRQRLALRAQSWLLSSPYLTQSLHEAVRDRVTVATSGATRLG